MHVSVSAILVTINPAYQEEELKYALNLVECKALITAPSLKTTNYLNILNTLAPELAVSGPGISIKLFFDMSNTYQDSYTPQPFHTYEASFVWDKMCPKE
jgi:acyl-CoA synthetase (AMP-forming)/AMP-acid ligase II